LKSKWILKLLPKNDSVLLTASGPQRSFGALLYSPVGPVIGVVSPGSKNLLPSCVMNHRGYKLFIGCSQVHVWNDAWVKVQIEHAIDNGIPKFSFSKPDDIKIGQSLKETSINTLISEYAERPRNIFGCSACIYHSAPHPIRRPRMI